MVKKFSRILGDIFLKCNRVAAESRVGSNYCLIVAGEGANQNAQKPFFNTEIILIRNIRLSHCLHACYTRDVHVSCTLMDNTKPMMFTLNYRVFPHDVHVASSCPPNVTSWRHPSHSYMWAGNLLTRYKVKL